MQVTHIDDAIGTLEKEILALQAQVAAGQEARAATGAMRGGTRSGARKGGRGSTAPLATLAPAAVPVAPTQPQIPPHFVPWTFQFADKPPFTVRIPLHAQTLSCP
jgi:hypothetical protein